MKKIIIGLMIAMLAFTLPAAADELIVEYNRVTKSVSISGTISDYDTSSRAVVMVLDSGYTFEGLEAGEYSAKQAVRHIREVQLEEAGFTFPAFEMPESAPVGECAVRVSIDGQCLDGSFYFITTNGIRQALNEIDAATQGTVFTKLSENAEFLGLDLEEYLKLSANGKSYVNEKISKDDFHADVRDAAAEIGQKNELLIQKLYDSVAFAVLGDAKNYAEVFAAIEKYNDVYGLDLSESGIMGKVPEGYRNAVLQRLAGQYFDEQTVEDGFMQNAALAHVESVKWGEFERTFKLHLDVLKINTQSFEVLSSTDKDSVAKSLAGVNFKDAAELEKLLKQAVENLTKGKPKIPSSNTSSRVEVGPLPVKVPIQPITDEQTSQNEKQPVFLDIDGYQWAEESILELSKQGIVNGREDGRFAPKDNITRAEFVKILLLSFGEVDSTAYAEFSDVLGDDWYYSYVATAYKNGLVDGYPDGSFQANGYVTRQDMAVLTFRFMTWKGLKSLDEAEITFADVEEISSYATKAISALTKTGVISGTDNNMFLPHNNASRAEAAKVVYGVLSLK